MTAPSRWQHVMVDIETMGHGPGAPVLAVGIVPFQIHPEQCELAPPEAHVEIRCTLKAQVLRGAQIDPDTVEWWIRQSKEAQTALLAEPRHETFEGFWRAVAGAMQQGTAQVGDLCVWAKPPQFDLVSMRAGFETAGVPVPWHPRNEMDLRTLLRAAKLAMQSGQDGWQEVLEVRPTIEHSAVADAVEQAEQVVRFYRRLYRR